MLKKWFRSFVSSMMIPGPRGYPGQQGAQGDAGPRGDPFVHGMPVTQEDIIGRMKFDDWREFVARQFNVGPFTDQEALRQFARGNEFVIVDEKNGIVYDCPGLWVQNEHTRDTLASFDMIVRPNATAKIEKESV